MSARFVANFVVLLVGAALLVFLYAFGNPLAQWVAVGAGSAAIVMGMYSFASAEQGVYQRIADVVICALGAWAIVAARVMNYDGRWLLFSAGAGLFALGAIGLVVREVGLGGDLRVGDSRIGADEFARLTTLQRDAEARR